MQLAVTFNGRTGTAASTQYTAEDKSRYRQSFDSGHVFMQQIRAPGKSSLFSNEEPGSRELSGGTADQYMPQAVCGVCFMSRKRKKNTNLGTF